ncbi:MAG: GNAT family N-acetyltransferase [Deltaproteobacteria bacterium]|nr:GNAT family N-acetyltransferase [Deltaproteobacteria bacterium]
MLTSPHLHAATGARVDALTVAVERTPDGLEAHLRAWDELAADAIDPNPFYEPYALLAAWRAMRVELEVVLVWAPNPLPAQPPLLTGLVPLVRHRRYRGAPVAALATWRHVYAYLGTPLVRAGRAHETLDALFDWLPSSGATLLELDDVRGDGAFRHALVDALNRRRRHAYTSAIATRAMFRRARDAETYLVAAMGGKKRKELRRQERRLAEAGAVAFDELPREAGAAALDAWIDDYLELEQRGWKGRGGTALRDEPAGLAAFRALAHGAHARGRWMTLALRLDGRPIAMKCNVRCGDGGVAYKIAYDEAFARFSPGVLLEVEHVRRQHEPGGVAWMDSGAAADHPMINHLWRDRATIETIVVSTGRPGGSLAVAAMPLVRWTARAARDVLRRFQDKATKT